MSFRPWHIIGKGSALAIIFATAMVLIIASLGIDDPYARILTGKVLSLIALSSFGKSEALKIYLDNHSLRRIGSLKYLNDFGSVFAIFISLILIWKIFIIDGALDASKVAAGNIFLISHIRLLLIFMRDNSEIIALLPLVYFALINVLFWLFIKDGEEIGKVCFVFSDIPVLVPMIVVFFLIMLIAGNDGLAFKLLLGGATVMLIFVSIILTECTKELLNSPLKNTIQQPVE